MNQFTPQDANDWVLGALESLDLEDIGELEAQLLLRTYLDEAAFFWGFLRPLLVERERTEVLEVGSGVGLLSLFASSEVKKITSLEPQSAGFNAMGQFREKILSLWRGDEIPVFKNSFLQDLPREEKFDFIYCINVLEHVPGPEELIEEIHGRLKPGGLAWFLLPNYSFPYEQHFEIPIFFNKRITERVFGNRIRNHQGFPNPVGLWAELSWPTQRGLRGFLLSRDWSHEFHRNVLGGYFERLRDPYFIERKGTLFRYLRPLLKVLRPAILALPLGVAPIIEFTISKPSGPLSKSLDLRP